MISHLNDLETRRKILFADDYFIIRTIGNDAVLITLNSKKISRDGFESARAFLLGTKQAKSFDSVIVDVTRGNFQTLTEAFAFEKVTGPGFRRFAILTRKAWLQLVFPFLLLFSKSTRIKLFKDLTSAITWVRSMNK